MAEIVWLPSAKRDIDRLYAFLRDRNTEAARKAIQSIRKGAKYLQAFPRSGRPTDDGTERRELPLSFGANGYVIRYKLDGEKVVVIRIWQGRERRES